MLVNAPAISSGEVGNTGVITSGATNEGVLRERKGDFGVWGRGEDVGVYFGLAARFARALTSGLPPRIRSEELVERAAEGDGAAVGEAPTFRGISFGDE